MTKYTVHYFNVKGRGEIVRLILVAAGVDFEDNRVEREDWPKLKPSQYACHVQLILCIEILFKLLHGITIFPGSKCLWISWVSITHKYTCFKVLNLRTCHM